MFLAARTVLRRERSRRIGGTGKNSRWRRVNEEDGQDQDNDAGRGHVMQGFLGLVQGSVFILRAMNFKPSGNMI